MEGEEKCSNIKKTKIDTRCSPSRLCSVVRSLNCDKKEMVIAMGFGNLLAMKDCKIKHDLIIWLIERFNYIDGSLNIHGKIYKLNSQIFGYIIGVENGGEDLLDIGFEDDSSSKKQKTSILSLEPSLKANCVADELFLRQFVLFVIGVFLMPNTSVYANKDYEEAMVSITNPMSIRRINWASMSFKYLIEGICRFKKKHSQFVTGCVHFLQIFYLHHIKGYDNYVDRSLCPIMSWSTKDCKHICNWINSLGGYGSSSISMHDMNGNTYINDICDHISELRCKVDEIGKEIADFRTFIMHTHEKTKEDIISEMKVEIRNALDKMRTKLMSDISLMLAWNHPQPPNTPINAPSPDEKDHVNVTKPISLTDDYRKIKLESKSKEMCKAFGSSQVQEESVDKGEKSLLQDNMHTSVIQNGSISPPDRIVINNDPKDKDGEHCDPQNIRQHEKSLSNMVDCYRKSKGCIVGPFKLRQPISVDDFKISLYIFDSGLSLSEIMIQHETSSIARIYMHGLLPEGHVDSKLIDAYSDLMTYWGKQQSKHTFGSTCLFLPCHYHGAPNRHFSKFWEIGQIGPIYTKGLFDNKNKIIVPFLDADSNHWFLVEINLKKNYVRSWDSLTCAIFDTHRDCIVREMLRKMDILLARNISDSLAPGWSFSALHFLPPPIRVPQQQNGHDCGIFVMKFMNNIWQGNECCPNFNPQETCLQLAIQLINSELNTICNHLIELADRHYENLTSRSAVNSTSLTIIRPPKANPLCSMFSSKKRRTQYWSRFSKKKSRFSKTKN